MPLLRLVILKDQMEVSPQAADGNAREVLESLMVVIVKAEEMRHGFAGWLYISRCFLVSYFRG